MPDLALKNKVILWHQTSLKETRSMLLKTQTAATAGTRVDGDHRPANRGERGAVSEQGYLAHGIGQRIQSIDDALDSIQKVGTGSRAVVTVGALVELAFAGKQRTFVILPGGGGKRMTLDQHTVTIISPDSPVARKLNGLELDEDDTLFIEGKTQAVTVTALI